MARKRSSTARLGPNNYGKSRVRMVKVFREGKRHTVREFDVSIALRGDFTSVHCDGDNALCLPTDTMKNTVYALGKDHPITTIESFALHLARHFVKRNRHLSSATVSISESPWTRLTIRGRPHDHAFEKGSAERQRCDVTLTRRDLSVSASISDLVLLKSTDSAFSGFPRDEYTTLAETDDRIFATSISAAWAYTAKTDYARARARIRAALIHTFAGHRSASVQHTLFAMGEAALRACKAIDSIHLSLPNRHCLLVNLAPFGLGNPNEIFVPTDEPHGLIEATIERA